MKTIMLIGALLLTASPAAAATCWQNEGGDRLTFTNATDGQLVTAAGKHEDCASGASEDGRDIACGEDAWSPSVRVPAKPGYVLKDVLVWRGEAWFQDCRR